MMKKILLLFGMMVLLTTSAQADVEINETNFPDDAFRSVIVNMPEGKDGILTDEEIAGIDFLPFSEKSNDILNLKGIEYFTGLKYLLLYPCCATELDLTANTALEIVHIELSILEKLTVTGLTSLRYFICQRTQLAEIDVSTCTALEYFYCNDSHLSSLDLSNNTRLKEVECRDNQLTSLILPQSDELTSVVCYDNHIAGEQMDALVASLPVVTSGKFDVFAGVDEAYAEQFAGENMPQYEFNVCTTDQVEVAKSKNWTVYGIYDGEELHEYAGSQPTAIRNPRQSETTSDCYTVDGRRVCSRDKQKGLYIQNGKKVVVK